MYLRRRCVVELIEKIVAQAEHRSSSTGRVVAQRLEQEEKSSPSTRPIRRAEGTRVIGSLGREFESRRLFQCSSTDVSGAHGRGRAPPGPVAQQRSTERGVAARLPMPDEGRSVRGDDVETRVRIPPARAASFHVVAHRARVTFRDRIATRKQYSAFRKIRSSVGRTGGKCPPRHLPVHRAEGTRVIGSRDASSNLAGSS